jgi:hypothetical protein
VERETTDYVAQEESSDTRIIPDAAFILENIESGKRALFFLEMDMGTERIVSQITRDKRISLFYKLIQYDRYLQGCAIGKRTPPLATFASSHSFLSPSASKG